MAVSIIQHTPRFMGRLEVESDRAARCSPVLHLSGVDSEHLSCLNLEQAK